MLCEIQTGLVKVVVMLAKVRSGCIKREREPVPSYSENNIGYHATGTPTTVAPIFREIWISTATSSSNLGRLRLLFARFAFARGDIARPARRDSSLPRLFGLLLHSFFLHFLHYDQLPEMVYGLRDNLYTTPIKRGRQREKKKREKKWEEDGKRTEVSNRKVKECVARVWRISRMSISREHGGFDTIVVCFSSFSR